MRCLCGDKLKVIDTLTQDDRVLRMRECVDCGRLYGPSEELRVSAVRGADPRPWAKTRHRESVARRRPDPA